MPGKFELGKFEKNEKPHINPEDVSSRDVLSRRVLEVEKAQTMANAEYKERVEYGDDTEGSAMMGRYAGIEEGVDYEIKRLKNLTNVELEKLVQFIAIEQANRRRAREQKHAQDLAKQIKDNLDKAA